MDDMGAVFDDECLFHLFGIVRTGRPLSRSARGV